jgi:lipopolysaccharide transport system ATP-binding protein
VIVLEKVKKIYHGASDEAILKYFEIKKDQGIKISVADTYVEDDYIPSRDNQVMTKADVLEWPAETVFNRSALPQDSENQRAKLTHLSICNERGNPCQVFKQGETAYLYVAYQVKENMGIPIAGMSLLTVTNLLIHSRNSVQLGAAHPRNAKAGDIVRYRQRIKLDLAPGNYIFNLNLSTMHPQEFDQKETFSRLEFKEKLVRVIGIKRAGIIEVISQSQTKAFDLHGGICNLDGEMHIQIVRP